MSAGSVLLMKMPWGRVEFPNVGLGILKSVLTTDGIDCEVFEAQMLLLRWVKWRTYENFSYIRMLGEFVFTHEFEPEVSDDQMEVLWRICREKETEAVVHQYGTGALYDPQALVDAALKLRQEIIPDYFDSLIERADLDRRCLVGFSNVYDQTLASVAFARRLKRTHPHVITAMGGPAFRGDVGRHMQSVFPEIDVVAYGDGEHVITPLVRAARGEIPFAEVPNITYRDQEGAIRATGHRSFDISKSPQPDYTDYFALKRELAERYGVKVRSPRMMIESSRGCWWGEKHHCTFCANDEYIMKWRYKPADKVLKELENLGRLSAESGDMNDRFTFVDDIMPNQYWKDFLPHLQEMGAPYDLFYEQKSNLNEARIQSLEKSGVRTIQVGIESFSTRRLTKMDKGVTGIQNAYTIYRCMSEGIQVVYNVLFGFPGDEPEDYAQELRLLPSLYHLVPPRLTAWIRLSRFSPLAEDREQFGGYDLVPFWRYGLHFSAAFREDSGLDLGKYCFFYNNPMEVETPPNLQDCYFRLVEGSGRWRSRFSHGAMLSFEHLDEGALVRDSRYTDAVREMQVGALEAAILEEVSHNLTTTGRLDSALAARFGAGAVARAVEDLDERRLLLREQTRLCGLCFPVRVYRSTKTVRKLAEMQWRRAFDRDHAVPEAVPTM